MNRRCSVNRRRREVVAGVTALLAGGPLFGQVAAPRKRLVYFTPADPNVMRETFDGMLAGLARRGFRQGVNLEAQMIEGVDWRELPARAKEIVARKPDVIVSDGTLATRAMQAATRVIPIVTSVADPVRSGFARSLVAPGGNITGLSQGMPEVFTKLVELARLVVPRISRIAFLRLDFKSSEDLSNLMAGLFREAAREARIEPVIVPYREMSEVRARLKAMPAQGVGAVVLIVGFDDEEMKLIYQDSIALRMPLFTIHERYVELGALIALAADSERGPDQLAGVVAQVLRGADPAKLPIQFPERFWMTLNRRTASALGIAVTPELLLRADRVID